MAGIAHITISPPLLKALNTTDAEELSSKPELMSLFDKNDIVQQVARDVPDQPLNLIDDEERFRILFTRRDNGLQEIKQVKAINVFADMQVKLEEVVSVYLSNQ